MSSHASSSVVVTGGSGAIAANAGELVSLASRFTIAADETAQIAAELRFWLFGPFDGWGAADRLLWPDPASAVARDAARRALAELATAELACRRIVRGIVRAVLGYDRAEHSVLRELGRLAHVTVVGETTLLATRDPGRAAQAALTDDPGVFYAAAQTGGLTAELRWLQTSLADDGAAIVVPTGIDSRGVAGRPPRQLSELLADLAQRNDDAHHGEIDVRVLTMPDGSRKAIVGITGTKRWDPRPSDDVTDPHSNVLALAGRPTAYERGVLAALHRAGVTKDDDVMLVGHSLGGMVAVDTAAHVARTGEFRVTHVVTAGAPIAATVAAVPRSIQVLALEDAHDIVPYADGRANPGRANVTTVVTRHGDASVGGDHHLRTSYLPAATDVQASRNRSARHAVAGLRGFLAASSVVTHTYQIRRA